MFNREDEYLKATKDAQFYTSVKVKSGNKKLVIVNILLSVLLGYLGFHYLQNNTNIFNGASLPVSKQAVLGVSETVDDVEPSNDVQNSMKVLMSEPSIQSKTSYTEAISRELDDKSGFKGKIAVAKDEDKSFSTREMN